jgi:hypothetical protein
VAEGAFAVAEAAVAAAARVAAAEETVAENIGAVRGCCGTTGGDGTLDVARRRITEAAAACAPPSTLAKES